MFLSFDLEKKDAVRVCVEPFTEKKNLYKFQCTQTLSYAKLVRYLLNLERGVATRHPELLSNDIQIYMYRSLPRFSQFQKETSIYSTMDSDGASLWSLSHSLAPLLMLLICNVSRSQLN